MPPSRDLVADYCRPHLALTAISWALKNTTIYEMEFLSHNL